MSGTMDIAVLQRFTSARVAQDSPGIGMSAGHVPAMHFLFGGRRSRRLLENLTSVVWMHGSIAITMKDNSGDRLSVTLDGLMIRPTLSHRDKR
jgi:hypothetical protein